MCYSRCNCCWRKTVFSSVPELPARKPVTIEVVVVCDIFFLTSPVRSVSVLRNNLLGTVEWPGCWLFVVGSLVFLFSCGAFRFGLLCVLHSSQKNCQHVFNPLPLQVAVPWREVVITRRQEVRKKTAVRFQSFRMPSACAVALVLLCICVAREWSPPRLAMCEGQKGPEEEATPIDPVRCERWGNWAKPKHNKPPGPTV